MSQSEQPPRAALVLREQDMGDTFADPAAFDHWHRVANMFAHSGLIPEHLRKQIPDVLIGLDLARRLHLNPLSVLQNLYVVKGTPGWKTQFLVALANGKGWDLTWETERPHESSDPDFSKEKPRLEWQRSTKNGSVNASAPNMRTRCIMERDGKRKVGIYVSLAQAIAAKWADNEQYVHSTQNQLEWRAAAFAIRKYDPNLTLGLPTAEEAADERIERVELVGDETVVEPAKTGLAAVRQAVKQPAQQAPTATAKPEKVKPVKCHAKHPVTGVECGETIEVNVNTGQLLDHRSHGYMPEGGGPRVWWTDAGEMSSPVGSPVATVHSPSPPSGSPSLDPQDNPEGGDQGEKSKVPRANAVLEADLILAGLVTQPRGRKIALDLCKRALREGLGAKQLGDERLLSALNFGVTRKMWEIVRDADGNVVGIAIPNTNGSSPPSDSPAGTEQLPSGTPSGGDLPDDPASLEQLIADAEYELGDTPPDLATAAGLPVSRDGEVITDGAPVPALQRYLVALRERLGKSS